MSSLVVAENVSVGKKSIERSEEVENENFAKELEKEIDDLEIEEETILRELGNITEKAATVCREEVAQLPIFLQSQEALELKVSEVQESLLSLHKSSEELSCRVKLVAKVESRLEQVSKAVETILQLWDGALGLKTSIQQGEYEKAVKFVSQIRSLPLTSHTEVEEALMKEVKTYEQQLTHIVRQQFGTAIAINDRSEVSRCAKLLFPLGLKMEGILRYISFIRHFLSDQCAANFRTLVDPQAAALTFAADGDHRGASDRKIGLYAGVLEKCFLAIADIVQEHQMNIEQEFGSENFVYFLRGLQAETDVQGLRILDKFYSDSAHILDIGQHSTSIKLREVDATLEELCLLSQRVQQFQHYLSSCSCAVLETLSDKSKENLFSQEVPPQEYSQIDGLLTLSSLMRRIQELMNIYVSLEHHFMQRNIERAIYESDEIIPSDEPNTSTLVDDCFFLMQKSINRAINASDVYSICAVVNHVNSLMTTDLKNAIITSLEMSQRPYLSYIQEHKHLVNFKIEKLLKITDSRRHRSTDESKKKGASLSWVHALNNVESCIANCSQLSHSSESEFDDHFGTHSPQNVTTKTAFRDGVSGGPGHTGGSDTAAPVSSSSVTSGCKVMFLHCLQGLDLAKSEFEALHQTHCQVAAEMLSVHLSQTFSLLNSQKLNLSAEEYEILQVYDPILESLLARIKEIHDNARQTYLPSTVETIMNSIVGKIVQEIEVSVFAQFEVTLLGAAHLDSFIRSIMTCLTTLLEQSIRHKFGRLIELGEILNVGTYEEFEEVRNYSSGKQWKISEAEIQTVIALRRDILLVS